MKKFSEYYSLLNEYGIVDRLHLKEKEREEKYNIIKKFANELKREFVSEVKRRGIAEYLPEKYIRKLEDYIGEDMYTSDAFFRKQVWDVIENFREFVYNYEPPQIKEDKNISARSESSVLKRLKQKIGKYSTATNSENKFDNFRNFLEDIKKDFLKDIKNYNVRTLYDYYMGIVNEYIFKIFTFNERTRSETLKLIKDFKQFILSYMK